VTVDTECSALNSFYERSYFPSKSLHGKSLQFPDREPVVAADFTLSFTASGTYSFERISDVTLK